MSIINMQVQDLLPFGLAFIMFAVGIGLRLDDFQKVFLAPRVFCLGLINQIFLLPLIGLCLALLYGGPVEFALGIMILAACPGGITSNLLSVLAGGNAALSVSMTAVTSLVSIISVPAVLMISQHLLLDSSSAVFMPIDKVMGGIFMITGVPIALGMALHHKWPALSKKLMPYMRKAATIIFAAIVIGAFVSNMDNITKHFADIGLFLIFLNIGTMAIGFMTSHFLRYNRADSITICMECGLQNVALAIFIAINVLNDPTLMIPAIIYALVMNVSAAIVIVLVRRTTVVVSTT